MGVWRAVVAWYVCMYVYMYVCSKKPGEVFSSVFVYVCVCVQNVLDVEGCPRTDISIPEVCVCVCMCVLQEI